METRSNQDGPHQNLLQLSAQFTIDIRTPNTSLAEAEPRPSEAGKKRKRNQGGGKRRQKGHPKDEATREIRSPASRPALRPKKRTRPPREVVVPASESEIPRHDPDVFFTQFSEERRITAPTLLACGFLVTAKSQKDSIVYAANIYNSLRPEKEFIVWTDASWVSPKPQQLACTAQTFKQNPRAAAWCDMITLVHGPKNAPFKLFGIHQAMDLALQQFPQTAGQDTVKIFTDSQTSMGMILHDKTRKYDADTEAILESIGRLARDLVFSTGCRLEIHWVKSHSGVPGNERADFLAGEARNAFVRNSPQEISKFMEYEELNLQNPERGSILAGRIPFDGFGLGAALKLFSSTYQFSGRRLR